MRAKLLDSMFTSAGVSFDTALVSDSLLINRTEKYLLALRCLNAAQALNAEHPRVKEQFAELQKAVESLDDAQSAKVKEVLKAKFSS